MICPTIQNLPWFGWRDIGKRRTCDAFSTIVHREKAEARAGHLLKAKGNSAKTIIQNCSTGCYWGKVIARETISAMRKDVTAKCYVEISQENESCWINKKKKSR